jgi:tetratricopeptide (TPR) repeat protein
MLHQARRSALASSGRHSFGIVLTFLTAVLSMAAGVQALAQNYDEFFKKCYANGDPDQTIIACSAVITTGLDDNIDLATAFKNRGNAYDDKGRYDRALEDYDQAITINPHDADAFNNRGTTHSAMGHYDLAIRDYDQAVRLNPSSAMTLNNRCFAKALSGQFEQALADCNESLRIKPKNPGALASRGFVYLKLKQYDAAITDYDAELHVSPDDPYSLFGRGKAKYIKGDLRGGDADIVAAESIKSDIVDHMAKLGVQLGEHR